MRRLNVQFNALLSLFWLHDSMEDDAIRNHAHGARRTDNTIT